MNDYRGGGWVKKGQNLDYVIFEWSLTVFTKELSGNLSDLKSDPAHNSPKNPT